MSYGFSRYPGFRLVGAADAENGKPSMGHGTLECNASYKANINLEPLRLDLSTVKPAELRRRWALSDDPTVLLACPPCTGFSRTLSKNHLVDDERNSLVRRVALFAHVLRPAVIVMENARELLMGGHSITDMAIHICDACRREYVRGWKALQHRELTNRAESVLLGVGVSPVADVSALSLDRRRGGYPTRDGRKRQDDCRSRESRHGVASQE